MTTQEIKEKLEYGAIEQNLIDNAQVMCGYTKEQAIDFIDRYSEVCASFSKELHQSIFDIAKASKGRLEFITGCQKVIAKHLNILSKEEVIMLYSDCLAASTLNTPTMQLVYPIIESHFNSNIDTSSIQE